MTIAASHSRASSDTLKILRISQSKTISFILHLCLYDCCKARSGKCVTTQVWTSISEKFDTKESNVSNRPLCCYIVKRHMSCTITVVIFAEPIPGGFHERTEVRNCQRSYEVNLINNNNESDLSDNGLEDTSDDDDDELNIDDIVDTNDDAQNKAFLDKLEKIYEEPKKFGDSIDNQMAKLVDQAINKPMKTETLTKLEELYLVPEN
ncbi:unnamed protein product [Mytilus coruscus]|uniref:Uncharacterized protein n=1 Tax=Mytilus coruscus TaxID=42192 RepID=A0A6J8BQI5_MYTCO|nr:unnamed protein product [Mytilus coruscus]